ncbi:hypothetical protein BDV95DRAFT_174543 [Massariosphaeria phaeospora]|uniref:DUF8040 domain-containing protein n=1 Tax=Massariosphaeria phaeospora TaxID=100035 RepID=A0A7C8M3I4_9PLEO|nr:hypothetical protein BDV95DRAFT_174543 [Massariosphaeria phaeospora]
MKLERPVAVALTSIVAAAAAAITAYTDGYTEPSGVRQFESDRDRGSAWVASCLSNDAQLLAETRLRPEVFEALVGWLREDGVRRGNALVEEKLFTFTYICGNGASWRNTQYRCGRSLDTMSKHFYKILNALI